MFIVRTSESDGTGSQDRTISITAVFELAFEDHEGFFVDVAMRRVRDLAGSGLLGFVDVKTEAVVEIPFATGRVFLWLGAGSAFTGRSSKMYDLEPNTWGGVFGAGSWARAAMESAGSRRARSRRVVFFIRKWYRFWARELGGPPQNTRR